MTARKVLLLSGAGLLLACYAYVLYLAGNPRVPDEYRAYYIDGSTAIPLRELKRSALCNNPYVPGTAVGHRGSPAAVLDGWSVPERTHRWSLGGKSEIVFYVGDAGLFEGRLLLRCFYFDRQRVRVTVNGRAIGSYVGTGEDVSRVLRFDPSLLLDRSLNRIGFELPDARSPGEQDRRVLALALREVTLF
mgnify:CR=1 FL=1